MTDTVPVPEVGVGFEHDAALYARHWEAWKRIDSWLYRTKRMLKERVVDSGPILAADRRVTVQGAGFDFDVEAILRDYPNLATGRTLTFRPATREQAERILSLVMEEVPGVDYATDVDVDLPEVRRLISAKGAIGKALAEPPYRGRKWTLTVEDAA